MTAGGKGELELEQPMMEVVQTHVLPSIEAVDPDVLQAICSLGCFKEKEKLIQHLLSPRSVDFCPRGVFLNALAAKSKSKRSLILSVCAFPCFQLICRQSLSSSKCFLFGSFSGFLLWRQTVDRIKLLPMYLSLLYRQLKEVEKSER